MRCASLFWAEDLPGGKRRASRLVRFEDRLQVPIGI